jgi:hypothetical protein
MPLITIADTPWVELRSSPKIPPATGAIAATLLLSSIPTRCDIIAPFDMPVTYTRAGVYRILPYQVVDQRAQEADVIDAFLHCVAAAVAGIPCQEPTTTCRTFRVSDDEALDAAVAREARHGFGVRAVSATAVKHQNQWYATTIPG